MSSEQLRFGEGGRVSTLPKGDTDTQVDPGVRDRPVVVSQKESLKANWRILGAPALQIWPKSEFETRVPGDPKFV